MKIIVIGGNGTIGSAVSRRLSSKHEVLVAGRNSGDIQVDISRPESILQLFESVTGIDGIVCAAGEAKWADFDTMSVDDFEIGLRSKLMGQVNLVRIGKNYLNTGGSFTLTTGILADHPVPRTASAALVNGGIHSFVQAVALEMKNDLRVNVVSSGMVEDAVDRYESYFPGHNPIPMYKVINAYVRSVEGKNNGEIIRVYDY